MLEQVMHDGVTLAIIIRSSFRQDGIAFFTPDSFSQQLGYMSHPKGHVIAPHVHNLVVREVEYTKEVLFVRSGRVRVDFFDNEKIYLESRVLHLGDVVLLAFGGHGFEVLEDCEMIEVKQGPYTGVADKTRFDPVAPEMVRIVGGPGK